MRIRSGDQRISVDAVATQGPSRPSRGVSVIRVPETELTPNVRRALRALIREVHQLRQDNKALRSNIRYMETLADRDVFLPVLNRRAFLRDVSRALALAERHDAPSSLIYLDLNGFKHINDRYGHGAGDAVLRQVVDLINTHVRRTDSVGRLGGDEFGIVLTLTPETAACQKASELAAAIAAAPVWRAGHALRLSAAWGVQALTPGKSVEQIMAAADAAMYARKRAEKAKNQQLT